ncbi:glycosyltransferase family 2 protein [Lignipirellula cremea]|uniref:Undecaprenyl-phosphate 4-deoxy-4-formamido-L-arabinose transferase n=1 Tax=Lignipirellula cremea TaxID=2528010 RepID=A0A518DYQ6_9BACT|nr:glycosyltransferase family 2 protein [Lignipirellula cremea]QDU96964.1 Undecaprenyl-phosphate 4-deoxy-4-formamido-L-arabinose transferase [Lignipirellula cremea]
MDVSIVTPVYNEVENIPRLYAQVEEAMRDCGRSYEIVFVDDGSKDGSLEELRQLAEKDERVKIVRFRRNYGQTAAMQAGLQWASGDVIVTIDGDLQNDPNDIPMMLDKIDEGYDLVHGWRKKRQDAWINRKLPSQIANWIISRTTGFPIHDLGCTLKAIRREIAQELELYGEMHRFIPILAHERGARCVEVVTNHHPRQFGTTKYGIGRTFRVVLDLITVKYMIKYFASPMKLFGMAGLWTGLLGAACGAGVIAMKAFGGVDMTGNPLLLMTFFSLMVAVQFLSLGLLGEVSARIYYGSQNKHHYAIGELINFSDHPQLNVHRAA